MISLFGKDLPFSLSMSAEEKRGLIQIARVIERQGENLLRFLTLFHYSVERKGDAGSRFVRILTVSKYYQLSTVIQRDQPGEIIT